MIEKFNLERFVDAQDSSYAAALAEIRQGRKQTHWMWFVFPQICGLGSSEMARRYAIRSDIEARAYLAHPLLGPRLVEAVGVLQDLTGTSAEAVFGSVDAVKLRSSLTLFTAVCSVPIFEAALARWFGGQRDPATRARLNPPAPGSQGSARHGA